MSAKADRLLTRLKLLPPRLRLAHLSALLRCEIEGSPRVSELKRLLSAQFAEIAESMNGGQAG
jgi:hypothetical protein